MKADTSPAAKPRRGILPADSPEVGVGKRDILIIVALVFLALGFRLYSLQFFHVISTDGTSYVGAARALASGDLHGVGIYGLYSVLIWVAGWVVSDLELAGRVVSIIFGSLLVVPLYLLGKRVMTHHAAVCASLLAVVWPPLVSFSCEVMTQALYGFLFLFSLYLVWRMCLHPSTYAGAMAGISVGLVFLTRPEGILLFLAAVPLYLVSHRERRTSGPMAAAYLAGFTAIFLANLFLVHNVTGEWQLSAKTDSALTDALSYYLNIPDLGYIAGYEPKGYLEIIRDHPQFIWHNSVKNARALAGTFPLWLWLLIATGFLSGGFSARANGIRLFLLTSIAPLAVLVVFYYVAFGYTEAYLPVFFLWGGAGLCVAESSLVKRIQVSAGEGRPIFFDRLPLAVTCSALYALVLFGSQLRADIPDSAYHFDMDNGRRDEKRIGLLLKENLPPGKIMTRWARIAFYAEREWINIPAGVGLDSVVKTARDNAVSYLVADGMLYSNRPGLGMEIFTPLVDEDVPYGKLFMTDPALRIGGLKPFFLYRDPRSAGVVIYEIPSVPE